MECRPARYTAADTARTLREMPPTDNISSGAALNATQHDQPGICIDSENPTGVYSRIYWSSETLGGLLLLFVAVQRCKQVTGMSWGAECR